MAKVEVVNPSFRPEARTKPLQVRTKPSHARSNPKDRTDTEKPESNPKSPNSETKAHHYPFSQYNHCPPKLLAFALNNFTR